MPVDQDRLSKLLGKKEPITYQEEKPANFTTSNEYFELKTHIHDRLLDLMDLTVIDSLDQAILRQEIRKLVERILQEEKNVYPLNMRERDKLVSEIQDEVLGLGP